MIFITHDLGAISKVADDLVVMNSGTIADRGSFSHILHHASDPYTRLLVEKRSAVMKNTGKALDMRMEVRHDPDERYLRQLSQ